MFVQVFLRHVQLNEQLLQAKNYELMSLCRLIFGIALVSHFVACAHEGIGFAQLHDWEESNAGVPSPRTI